MADIRPFRRPASEETEAADRRERQERRRGAGRRRMRKAAAGILLAAVCLSAVLFVYFRNKEYSSYRITDWTSLTNIENSQVASFGGNIIRYNSDGAACLTYQNEQVWNQPYEMQTPVLAAGSQALAIGELGGNAIYVFGEDGLKGQIETLLPIQKIAVANNYAVAVLLKDGATNWIYYYSSDGTVIAQMRISLDQMGYPVALALSPSGRLLAVSYLNVAGGDMKSTVSFYNFDSVGQEYTDRLVKAKSYEDVVFPALQFLDGDTAAAFGDDRVVLFEGGQIPEDGEEIPVEGEILMAFSGDDSFALVTAKEEEETAYQLRVFSGSGDEKLAENISGAYTAGKIEDNKIILYHDTEILIYTMNGVRKFQGTYETAVRDVIPAGGDTRYLVVTANELDRIKLDNK